MFLVWRVRIASSSEIGFVDRSKWSSFRAASSIALPQMMKPR